MIRASSHSSDNPAGCVELDSGVMSSAPLATNVA
jgi:hypothetical protein